MIRITQQNSASSAKRYYATADYYSEGQEIVGSWGGKGATRLGLEGTVDKFSFERLCDNLDPRTGEPLTVRTRTERRVGYDFTFSVPKSVSLLYAMSGDQDILEAFRASVDDTMREIETEMKTRVRMNREDCNRTTGNMVWAEFIHTTSRPVEGIPDPQLHAHVFVFNTTWDGSETRWKAGQFADIKRDSPYFQAAFRVRLANRLQDLGFGVERKRDDFEIAGIPKDVLGRFSRRTALIEKVAEEKGITDPKRKDLLGAETREKKESALSWESLRKLWNTRLTDRERTDLAAVHRRDHVAARLLHGEALAVDHAVEHSFVRDAVLPERKLLTEALKRGLGAVTVDDVTREMQDRPLIRSEIDGRKMATTKEMLAQESKLIDYARLGRGRCRPLGDPERPCSRDWFNEGQKAAVAHVLGSRDRVMIIRGVAGTGKTTLEQEIGEALAEVGKPVVALAQSVKASREVLREEAGFANADTVALFLKDKEMQASAKGGVILVDEASMLGTRDMLRVFGVAEGVGARVILVGDRRQHRSVTAGEPLKLLEEKAGLRVAQVTEIHRQKGDYKKVAQALSDGRTGEAFEELDRLGWIKQVPDEDRYEQLAAAYLSAAAEKKKDGNQKSALVVSPTHAEAARITLAIRAGLKTEGKLGDERMVDVWIPKHLTDAQKADATEYDTGDLLQFHQNATGHQKGSRQIVEDGMKLPTELANRFEVYRPMQLPLAVGDRVRLTAGGKTKDGEHRLSNGSLLTVQGFTKRGDLIVDHGWIIDRDFGHLSHGYVVTSHASQGVTVDKVFVGVSSESFPATYQRTAYVALTRGREQAQIYTDDKTDLLKAIRRMDEPLSATELSEDQQQKPALTARLMKRLGFSRGFSVFDGRQNLSQPGASNDHMNERGLDHAG
ncbi:MAG: relaxase domain-containing protein [Planctomycetes bacterium]|nr:relaxase domain-containing protein [Planctomycetota bacterium]